MKLTRTRLSPRRTDRDAELRDAHQRTFDRMRNARSQPDRQLLVSEAVNDLIMACEKYIQARSNEGRSQAG